MLVHPSSAESTTFELDLFSVPPIQTNLEDSSFTKYHPVSAMTSTGPIEFTVNVENSNYIDLANSFLYEHASVTASEGANLAKNVEIAPKCNFLHTLWSQVDVYLNGSLVTQSNNYYLYRASFAVANKGCTQGNALAAESKEIDNMVKLHIDLTFKNRYLLNGVEVRLRLIRSKDLFSSSMKMQTQHKTKFL